MSRDVERLRTCAHREACERMAAIAGLAARRSRSTPPDEAAARAYGCGCCNRYERREDR